MIGERETDSGIVPVEVPPRTTLNPVSINTKVFLALPWYKSANPITAFCVASLMDRRRTTTCMNFGDAFVSHSRNSCAELFLASKCDWMLMIDDDMLIPFGNARWFNAYAGADLPEQFAGLNALDRLLSHGKTLVGGLYFGRHSTGAAMYSEGACVPKEGEFARKAPIDMIKPTRWVATGCLLVHRQVFLDIEKRFPRLARNRDGKRGHWFTSSEHAAIEAIDKCREMLSEGPMTGEKAVKALTMMERASHDARHRSSLGMGEDVQFCIRATEAGHQPYVDLGLVCGHIGQAVYGPWNIKAR